MEYRRMRRGEEQAVAGLANRVFDRTVASDMTPEGVAEFRRWASAGLIARRSRADHAVLVASEGDSLCGMIEIRQGRHVAMLFVERAGEGIGRELMRRAVKLCRRQTPGLERITVNSAPGAVGAYRRMGFAARGEEQIRNGIRFVPMSLELD